MLGGVCCEACAVCCEACAVCCEACAVCYVVKRVLCVVSNVVRRVLCCGCVCRADLCSVLRRTN